MNACFAALPASVSARREHAFVSASERLGAPPPGLDRSEALARLARRYLAVHGPADARDLARWAKLRLGDARAALEPLSDEPTMASSARSHSLMHALSPCGD